ncbi:MAG: hypothetical protein ABFD92_10010 [Planctomycetaceae bacterium]|nr:hypothetical protein [Planctomycetaceae bacterium]
MKSAKILLVALVACVAVAAGCEKKVLVTVMNHSDLARSVKLSTPDETIPMGTVGAEGGRQSMTLAVKTSDLPAQCRIAAETGSDLNFPVTDDTPSKLWFHITKGGKLVGPYRKNDVHAETEKTIDVSEPVRRTMELR